MSISRRVGNAMDWLHVKIELVALRGCKLISRMILAISRR
jgi:hypothetical protein